LIQAGHSSGCDRTVTVLGSVEDRTGCTVMLVEQEDGSWLIEGTGLPPIRLTREVMRIVAEHVLRDDVAPRSPTV
jgi:hypothetical protein